MTPNRWPRSCLFEAVEWGQRFTMKFCNEEWIRIRKDSIVKGGDNAVSLEDGHTFKFKKDSVVYPL